MKYFSHSTAENVVSWAIGTVVMLCVSKIRKQQHYQQNITKGLSEFSALKWIGEETSFAFRHVCVLKKIPNYSKWYQNFSFFLFTRAANKYVPFALTVFMVKPWYIAVGVHDIFSLQFNWFKTRIHSFQFWRIVFFFFFWMNEKQFWLKYFLMKLCFHLFQNFLSFSFCFVSFCFWIRIRIDADCWQNW